MSNRIAALNAANKRLGELGQDLVEFALVLPLLLGLFLGICEFGILISDYNTVANASREGARYGIAHPALANSGTCSGASTGVVGAACTLTLRLDPAKVSVATTTNIAKSTITVEVEYETKLLTAVVIEVLGGKSDVTLTASSTMQLEQ